MKEQNIIKAEVVMLPTSVRHKPNYAMGYIVKCVRIPEFNGEVFDNEGQFKIGKLTYCVNFNKGVLDYHEAQHLYIVADIDPKDGDTVLVNSGTSYVNEICTFKSTPCPPPYVGNKYICKVVVASTDETRKHHYGHLSRISDDFLKAYVSANGSIKEVSIEMKDDYVIELGRGYIKLQYDF